MHVDVDSLFEIASYEPESHAEFRELSGIFRGISRSVQGFIYRWAGIPRGYVNSPRWLARRLLCGVVSPGEFWALGANMYCIPGSKNQVDAVLELARERMHRNSVISFVSPHLWKCASRITGRDIGMPRRHDVSIASEGKVDSIHYALAVSIAALIELEALPMRGHNHDDLCTEFGWHMAKHVALRLEAEWLFAHASDDDVRATRGMSPEEAIDLLNSRHRPQKRKEN